jgi:muramoyltetrapeptide carboxypeptidase
MDRKFFLNTTGALITGLTLPLKKITGTITDDEEVEFKRPPYLKPGNLIGITSPAGYSSPEEIRSAVAIIESWGFKTIIGDAIGKKDFTRGGTDQERLADLQKMLDDPQIRAIMCSRGGYGSVRIVDGINWTKFKTQPKWIIGFSDITVLHSHIHRVCKSASIHSKMTNSFPDDMISAEPVVAQTIDSIRDALSGKKMNYDVSPQPRNKPGIGDGILTGGNLKTLESLAGSASDIQTAGKILFVEDTGEYLYSIDRMFWNLKRTGKLENLKGLIVGGFKIRPDDPGEEFGKDLYDIVLEKVNRYNYPVCFEFPVGHQKANYPMKCGVRHRLSVSSNEVNLKEIS